MSVNLRSAQTVQKQKKKFTQATKCKREIYSSQLLTKKKLETKTDFHEFMRSPTHTETMGSTWPPFDNYRNEHKMTSATTNLLSVWQSYLTKSENRRAKKSSRRGRLHLRGGSGRAAAPLIPTARHPTRTLLLPRRALLLLLHLVVAAPVVRPRIPLPSELPQSTPISDSSYELERNQLRARARGGEGDQRRTWIKQTAP